MKTRHKLKVGVTFMKKLLFSAALIILTQNLHAGVSMELNCRHQNLILTYSGPSPVDPGFPYHLRIENEEKTYTGIPFEADIASQSESAYLEFKYKEVSKITLSENKTATESKIDRTYFLNIQFVAIPLDSSQTLKKLTSDNPILQFTCTESINNTNE
jgi:hypothetical protein